VQVACFYQSFFESISAVDICRILFKNLYLSLVL
jgi:hypothetical protein